MIFSTTLRGLFMFLHISYNMLVLCLLDLSLTASLHNRIYHVARLPPTNSYGR
jgi:hypothetical protein